jgi:hypothetical protein
MHVGQNADAASGSSHPHLLALVRVSAGERQAVYTQRENNVQ